MNQWIVYIILKIWESTWGKVGLIAVVLLILGAIVFVRWLNKAALRQFTDLQPKWPHCSWQAVEYRVRTAAELYFHGWNDGDISALKPHMTPNGFIALMNEVDSRNRKPFTVLGFKKPKIGDLRMPNEDQPLSVLVETEVHLPHLLSQFGFGWATFLFETVYSEDGRWLVDSIRRDDSFTAVPDLENEPDTSWMEAHPPATPHRETSDPQRPPVIYKPIRGKRRMSFYLGAKIAVLSLLALFCLGLAGATIHRNNLDKVVRETGVRTEADVTHSEYHEKEKVYCVSYQFQLPGSDEKYTWRNLYGFEAQACVTKEPGPSKKIVIIYLPDDPRQNLPVDSPSFITSDFLIAVPLILVVVIGLLIANAVVYRRLFPDSFSFFWPAKL